MSDLAVEKGAKEKKGVSMIVTVSVGDTGYWRQRREWRDGVYYHTQVVWGLKQLGIVEKETGLK